jgi:large subunit ribosomal protein L18
MALTKLERRNRINLRIRKKIRGTAERPRLSVFRSNKQIYAQVIDDLSGVTIVSASSKMKDVEDAAGKGLEQAAGVGKLIAQKCKEKSVEHVVFDRGGYKYHGRVKALADAAREGGLKF